MKVAAVQYAPVLGDLRNNLKLAATLTLRAIQAGARIIVLPELCLSGYGMMNANQANEMAESPDLYQGSMDQPSTHVLGSLAQKHNCTIAWGFIERDVGTGKLYNSQMIRTPDKHVICRKLNHWGNDFLWASEGRESPPIIPFEDKKLGSLICRDIRDKGPQWSPLKDFYEPGDADIVCFSANFGAGAFPSVSWIEFARTNKVWLIVSNRYGEEMPNDFGHGGICVIEPEGKVHCEGLVWDQPCIVYADVP